MQFRLDFQLFLLENRLQIFPNRPVLIALTEFGILHGPGSEKSQLYGFVISLFHPRVLYVDLGFVSDMI